MESIHGTFGFRTGTPKLKTLKGFTWASVTNMLKEFLPSYIRTVEEPAKDKLLADRDNEEVNTLFGKVGSINDTEYRRMSTFPADFDFCGYNVRYVCGMSVPPFMIQLIAEEIKRQWF